MGPHDTARELVEPIRTVVPVVTGTSTLGAPLPMDLSMMDGHPASHNENYVHSWLQDTVDAPSTPTIGQDRMLWYVGLRRSACGVLLCDHVCGSKLWVLSPHPP
jgi:hypothetical protein